MYPVIGLIAKLLLFYTITVIVCMTVNVYLEGKRKETKISRLCEIYSKSFIFILFIGVASMYLAYSNTL